MSEPPWLRFYGGAPKTLQYPATTLYEAVAKTAARLPDTIAWEFEGAASTYRRLIEEVDRAAGALAALGLKPGDRMLISMPTSPPGVIAFYAANRLGATPALIHPLATAPEITHYLDASGARIALVLDAFYSTMAAATPKAPLTSVIIACIPDYLPPLKRLGFWLTRGRKIGKIPEDPRVRWWADLMGSEPASDARAISTGAEDPAAILFSGGTTGQPKGIVLSNRNFIAESMQVAAWGGIHEGDAMLAILPLFHGFGLGVCVNAVLMAISTTPRPQPWPCVLMRMGACGSTPATSAAWTRTASSISPAA